MRARTWLLALAAATGLATTAAAEPPINPLVEGREPDPVAQQFHQTDLPPGGYVAAPEISTPPTWATMTDMVWEALLDQLTFPLGTATSPREQLGA